MSEGAVPEEVRFQVRLSRASPMFASVISGVAKRCSGILETTSNNFSTGQSERPGGSFA